MKWVQAQVILSITRAPTCVLSSQEISVDTQHEGKSINTAVSPALICTSSVGIRHNRSSVYISIYKKYSSDCHQTWQSYNLKKFTSIVPWSFIKICRVPIKSLRMDTFETFKGSSNLC